ncbi:MAG: N-6 DNA methylase [Bacillota bacterium]|nr:N-6 DNA methylase [Bacillota bacterium]
MLNFDVKRKINTLRDILVGKVPDPKAQVEQITIALIYKFMDDMDLEGMELGGRREFFKEEYEKYAWVNIMQPENSGQQRANLYAEGIDKMSVNPNLPQLFRDIFRGAYVPYRDPETLNMFLKEINDFSYDHSEDLGNAFEYLLSIMGSQGDAGQFRTPRHIIDMIVEIVDPQKTDSILDPACGTAGFLISSYKHILNNNRDKDGNSTLSADERKRLTESIAGYDISPDMVRLSRVNMYLHRFSKPQIHDYDTLSKLDRWDETYDIILANPPFMTPKGGIIPHNRYRIQAKRSEVLFVDYIAEHLNPTGKAGIIVPEGIVFQSANAYKALRQYLIDDNLLYAVISLPAGVFNPYSGVKTSILLFDKTLAKQRNTILFVKINNDGYDLGAQRREVKGNDIPDVIRIIKDYQNGLDVSDNELVTVASKKDVAEKDYVLVGERYKKTDVIDYKYQMLELKDICTFINGKAFKPTDWSDADQGGRRIIRIQNLNDNKAGFNYYYGEIEDRYLVINGDLLFSWSGSKGTSFGAHIWKGVEAVLNQHIFKVEYSDIVNKEYLYLALNQAVSEVEENLHGGVGLVHITKSDLEKIKIPVPPLTVQEEIVKEIEGYQKIIDGAKQVVENYRPTIKTHQSWEIVRVEDVVEFVSGVTLSVGECEDPNGLPLITIADVSEDGHLKMENIRTVSTDKNVNILKKGDLLFNWRNGSKHLVGKTALFDLDSEYIFASFLLGIRPDNTKINSKFMWILLNQYRVEGKYMQFMRQNVNGLFNREELKDVLIPLPSLDDQHKIVVQIDEEISIVEQNKRLIEIFEQKIKDKIAEVWGE